MFDERAFIHQFEQARTPERLAEFLREPSPDEERALRLYLGDERFGRMRYLAARLTGRRGPRDPDRNVVVLPGIMGSELTVYEPRGSTLVWLSYYRIWRGWLSRLRLDAEGRHPYDGGDYEIRSTGLLNRYYGELLLYLGQSWNVLPFPYDWRKDLDLAAAELDAFLGAHFGDRPVSLVAHSLGGLVARSLLLRLGGPSGSDERPIRRLVMLGTPNYGSFEIPQIFGGIQGTVRQLVRLMGGLSGLFGSGATRERLLAILDSFPALYQMLPWPDAAALRDEPDARRLYAAPTYDRFNAGVTQAHLDSALARHEAISEVVNPEGMVYVAGYDQVTAVGIRDYDRLDTEEGYRFNYLGDGSVPHSLGLLPGVATMYVRRPHVDLPVCPEVLAVIDDLIERGREALPPGLRSVPAAAATEVPAADVARQRHEQEERLAEVARRLTHRDLQVARGSRAVPGASVEAARAAESGGPNPASQLSPDEHLLEELILRGGLPPMTGGASAPGVRAPRAPVASLTVRLVCADIARFPDDSGFPAESPPAAPVDALAVGHYLGGRPQRALKALDEAVSASLRQRGGQGRVEDRLLSQYVDRGVLRGHLGEPFFLPDPRAEGRLLAVAGMGVVGGFATPELILVARELCWALDRLGKRHLATLLIGAGPGNLSIDEAVPAFLEGVAQALPSTAPGSLRELTFVESDPRRMDQLDRALAAASESLKERLEITYKRISESELADYLKAGVEEERRRWEEEWSRRQERPGRINEEPAAPTRVSVGLAEDVYTFGAMTADAAIPERRVAVDPRLVAAANDALVAAADPAAQRRHGLVLGKLLVPRDLRAQFHTSAPLVMMVDSTTARIHWEMVAQEPPDGAPLPPLEPGRFPHDAFLGTARGITRQLRTQFAQPPEPPPSPSRVLRILVVADPAADAPLPGATEEGAEIAELFDSFNHLYQDNYRVEVVRLFGPSEATRVAVLGTVMLESFDVLHFAGHCFYDKVSPPSSGWLFSGGEVLAVRELRRLDRVPRFVFSNACESGVTRERPEGRSPDLPPSFAEAFFEVGVANFLCTGWPVDDLAARLFARHVYAGLLGLDVATGPALRIKGVREPLPMYRAMHEARRKVAESPGGARTWGAYQHYGNPHHLLFDPAAVRPREAPAPEGVKDTKPPRRKVRAAEAPA